MAIDNRMPAVASAKVKMDGWGRVCRSISEICYFTRSSRSRPQYNGMNGYNLKRATGN